MKKSILWFMYVPKTGSASITSFCRQNDELVNINVNSIIW